MPVQRIDRRRSHLHQDLVVAGNRLLDVAKLQYIGGTVVAVDDSLDRVGRSAEPGIAANVVRHPVLDEHEQEQCEWNRKQRPTQHMSDSHGSAPRDSIDSHFLTTGLHRQCGYSAVVEGTGIAETTAAR